MNRIFTTIIMLFLTNVNSIEDTRAKSTEQHLFKIPDQKYFEPIKSKLNDWRDTNLGELYEIVQDKEKTCNIIKSITVGDMINCFAFILFIYVMKRWFGKMRESFDEMDRVVGIKLK